MIKRYLSSEISSLIHHVELNKSGWWKKAVGQILKGVLWKADQPLTYSELVQSLESEVGVTMLQNVVELQVKALVNSGELVEHLNGAFKLSESTRAALTEAQHVAIAEQNSCKAAFIVSITELCPTLLPEEIWREFSNELAQAIRVIGANTFHLLASGNLEREANWLQPLLDRFTEQEKLGFRQCLLGFFIQKIQGAAPKYCVLCPQISSSRRHS